jgi:hypothetical protein
VVIVGADALTVNVIALLATPPTDTVTGPEVAPVGTLATIDDADQLVIVADLPLNATTLVPCDEPKFDPEIVTEVPIRPLVGESEPIVGTGGGGPAGSSNATSVASALTSPAVS